MQILYFEDYEQPARALAAELKCTAALAGLHRFPDGESLVQLPTPLSGHVIFCQTLHYPNNKLIELLLAAKSARQQGATRVSLVAPYLCYMRQDKAFIPGQAVSQQIIGGFLGDLFDDVITVDPHLHRIERLDQAVPAHRALSLTAAGVLGDYINGRYSNAVFIGPDEESEQWVKVVAAPGNADYVVARKTRYGDKSVTIELPDYDFAGKTAVLVDDVISSGHTMAVAARVLAQQGASRVVALCTHALLAPGAEKLLEESGIDALISTDSIPHPSNQIQLAVLLAEAVRKLDE